MNWPEEGKENFYPGNRIKKYKLRWGRFMAECFIDEDIFLSGDKWIVREWTRRFLCEAEMKLPEWEIVVCIVIDGELLKDTLMRKLRFSFCTTNKMKLLSEHYGSIVALLKNKYFQERKPAFISIPIACKLQGELL